MLWRFMGWARCSRSRTPELSGLCLDGEMGLSERLSRWRFAAGVECGELVSVGYKELVLRWFVGFVGLWSLGASAAEL
jgi:hypothetical protein